VPSDTNERISHRLAVVVIVGAVFAGHLTLVNVLVKLPAPVLRSKTKLLLLPTEGMVNVQFPVSVTVCTVPFARDIVCAVPLLPIATWLSI